MIPHSTSKEELLNHLETDPKRGLSSDSVQSRQAKFGLNKLNEKKKKSLFARFLDQFKDVMILILIAAAIISFVIVCVEKNWGEIFEPALILLIVDRKSVV